MWAIKIHPLVFKEDFKSIPVADQTAILKSIKTKLSVDPEHFGKPLRGEFFHYWRLRVAHYRIVYRMIKDEVVVLVIKIGIRKDDHVYRELFARIKKS